MYKSATCQGNKCKYYNKYYSVIKYQGGFLPAFNLTEERCKHPKIFIPKGSIEDDLGLSLNSIRECPIKPCESD